MTNQDKIYSREMALHEFEVSVDIYLRCGLTNEDIIALIKKKHVETSAKLEKIHIEFMNASKPQDPFKD
jgi:hypothetical protein